jgi:hypothetical protein
VAVMEFEMNTVDIRIHENRRIMVNWQGPGTYYLVQKLGLWLKINNTEIAEFVEKRQMKTVEIKSESEVRR